MPRLPASELMRRLAGGERFLADGAMGTELLTHDPLAEQSLSFNRSQPDLVQDIHRAYVEAGARFLLSNTFAPPRSIEQHEDFLAGWHLLTEVCADSPEELFPACSIYPETALRSPELMDSLFARDDAPDIVLIETCTSLSWAREAVHSIRERTDAVIFVTGYFHELRLPDKMSSRVWAQTWKTGQSVAGFGANCGYANMDYLTLARSMNETRQIGKRIHKPLIFKPSADQRNSDDECPPDVWADMAFGLFDCGASIVGGCCGTTPAHIAQLNARLHQTQSS